MSPPREAEERRKRYQREEAERVAKRSTKAQMVDYLARVMWESVRRESDLSEARSALADAQVKLDEYKSIEAAIEGVKEHRRLAGEPKLSDAELLSEILDKGTEIAAAIERGKSERDAWEAEREEMLAALGLTDHEWACRRTYCGGV